MTHSDIYRKFMIEYDKENITSSYPSLTLYEQATLLDKAYLAIIAQKLTGNNPRQIQFEGDNKAIEDVRPLITRSTSYPLTGGKVCSNDQPFNVPNQLLYYIDAVANLKNVTSIDNPDNTNNFDHNIEHVDLISHLYAAKFMNTNGNLPWIEKPVCFIEGDKVHVLFDSFKYDGINSLEISFIKKPLSFVESLNNSDNVNFELSDSMAEELINLAIIFATQTVEDSRLTTKAQIRPLES